MAGAAKPKAGPKAAQPSAGVAPARRARGFDAGKAGRRLKSIPTSTSAINGLIRQYGKNVLARSRWLAMNNPYAVAARDEYVSALVGCGIKPSPLTKDNPARKAELVEVWGEWTDESDADGLTDFYGQQAIIAGEMFEAGECFVRLRSRLASDGLTVPLQLQLLPAEMLPLDHNAPLANGGRIECGIEFSPIGKRVAYHFLRKHPGDSLVMSADIGKGDRVRVPAEEVLHLYRPIRAGQLRGIPHTLSGIITMAMLDLYDDAELERKRTAALFGAFVTNEAGASDETHPFSGAEAESDPFESTPSTWAMEPGATIDLDPGQKVEFAEPADVGGNYEAFQYRMLLRAMAGFGATYAATGDLRQTSYGSIRAGLVAFRRRIEMQQHQVMVFQFCRPVWNYWLRLAITNGALESISATEYLAAPRKVGRVKWIPPKWEWIDPLKDRQAEKLAVDSGFKARSDVIEAEGYDPEEVDARIAADQERAESLDIKFVVLGGSVVVSPTHEEEEPEPAPAPPGAPDDGDEEEDPPKVKPAPKKKKARARKSLVDKAKVPPVDSGDEFDFG